MAAAHHRTALDALSQVRHSIDQKLRQLTRSLLGTLSYAIQLQKTCTVKYQRSLLAGALAESHPRATRGPPGRQPIARSTLDP